MNSFNSMMGGTGRARFLHPGPAAGVPVSHVRFYDKKAAHEKDKEETCHPGAKSRTGKNKNHMTLEDSRRVEKTLQLYNENDPVAYRIAAAVVECIKSKDPHNSVKNVLDIFGSEQLVQSFKDLRAQQAKDKRRAVTHYLEESVAVTAEMAMSSPEFSGKLIQALSSPDTFQRIMTGTNENRTIRAAVEEFAKGFDTAEKESREPIMVNGRPAIKEGDTTTYL